jgi:hypothetical protein
MAFVFSGPQSLGIPGGSGTANAPLTNIYTATPDGTVVGQEIEAKDLTNGYFGKFKLLYGVASTVVGSLVSYDSATGLTTLSPTAGNSALPLAVAMSANTATTSLGWYQITGPATIKKTAVQVLPNVKIFLSATAGRIKVLASAGMQILGARTSNTVTVTSTTSTVRVTLGAGGIVQQGQVT